MLISKIFFGVGSKDPNGKGLSRKHIVEAANASLSVGLPYWDVLMAHRPDLLCQWRRLFEVLTG